MTRPSRLSIALVVALAVGASSPSAAQRSGNGYRLQQPNATISIRGGYAHANAGSDIFEDVTRQLTVDRRDFSSLTVGADLAIRLGSRTDLLLSGELARTSKSSEFRDLVGDDRLPIEQSTTFERTPLTVNLRYYLSPPGRTVGTLAWIPARFAPYVGVGAGAMYYRFRQAGEFVNFESKAIFYSELESKDWTFVGQALAGGEYSLSPSVGLIAEARYLRAKAELDRLSFSDYERIDLSGVSATIGLSLRL